MAWILGLIVFYVVHAARSPAVPDHQRAVWIVVVCVANAFAMPVYWWLFVWREGEGERVAYHRA
jgi:EamA domain-containing membrane protein RarD